MPAYLIIQNGPKQSVRLHSPARQRKGFLTDVHRPNIMQIGMRANVCKSVTCTATNINQRCALWRVPLDNVNHEPKSFRAVFMQVGVEVRSSLVVVGG